MNTFSKSPYSDAADQPETYTIRGRNTPSNGGDEMALLALSHTPVEHLLYEVMRGAALQGKNSYRIFSVRHLMQLTGLNNYSTVRRGRDGLLNKKSIEASEINESGRKRMIYTVFSPLEIFSRRRAAG